MKLTFIKVKTKQNNVNNGYVKRDSLRKVAVSHLQLVAC